MATTANDLARYSRPPLLAGAAAAVLAAVGAFLNLQWLLHAYLVAYFFWLSIALGCLAVLMLQNLAGGYWGAVIRRFLEAATRTIPLMAVLFLPILAGLFVLYPWTNPENLADVAVPGFKLFYLSIPFWVARAVLYFAVWILLGRAITRWSYQRDDEPSPELTLKMRRWSAIGLVLLGLTTTFAAFDWLMSLQPKWASSIYGAMISVGALLTSFAFVIALLVWLARHDPFSRLVSPELFNRLGSLLLAFLMLWAYLSFSQLMLIYAGNLPEENIWYVQRIAGGWLILGLVMAFLHFILPFCILIVRDFKRNSRILGATAALLVVSDYLNLFWVIRPSFADGQFTWLDIVLPVAIGGLWLAAFAWLLARKPLVGKYDPMLIRGMESKA